LRCSSHFSSAGSASRSSGRSGFEMMATVFRRVEFKGDLSMSASFSCNTCLLTSNSRLYRISRWLASKLRMEQKFAIAFAATATPEDGRFDPFGAHAPEFSERRLHLGHSRLLCRFVAHDSTFTHQFPARFELRLHQHHNLA